MGTQLQMLHQLLYSTVAATEVASSATDPTRCSTVPECEAMPPSPGSPLVGPTLQRINSAAREDALETRRHLRALRRQRIRILLEQEASGQEPGDLDLLASPQEKVLVSCIRSQQTQARLGRWEAPPSPTSPRPHLGWPDPFCPGPGYEPPGPPGGSEGARPLHSSLVMPPCNEAGASSGKGSIPDPEEKAGFQGAAEGTHRGQKPAGREGLPKSISDLSRQLAQSSEAVSHAALVLASAPTSPRKKSPKGHSTVAGRPPKPKSPRPQQRSLEDPEPREFKIPEPKADLPGRTPSAKMALACRRRSESANEPQVRVPPGSCADGIDLEGALTDNKVGKLGDRLQVTKSMSEDKGRRSLDCGAPGTASLAKVKQAAPIRSDSLASRGTGAGARVGAPDSGLGALGSPRSHSKAARCQRRARVSEAVFDPDDAEDVQGCTSRGGACAPHSTQDGTGVSPQGGRRRVSLTVLIPGLDGTSEDEPALDVTSPEQGQPLQAEARNTENVDLDTSAPNQPPPPTRPSQLSGASRKGKHTMGIPGPPQPVLTRSVSVSGCRVSVLSRDYPRLACVPRCVSATAGSGCPMLSGLSDSVQLPRVPRVPWDAWDLCPVSCSSPALLVTPSIHSSLSYPSLDQDSPGHAAGTPSGAEEPLERTLELFISAEDLAGPELQGFGPGPGKGEQLAYEGQASDSGRAGDSCQSSTERPFQRSHHSPREPSFCDFIELAAEAEVKAKLLVQKEVNRGREPSFCDLVDIVARTGAGHCQPGRSHAGREPSFCDFLEVVARAGPGQSEPTPKRSQSCREPSFCELIEVAAKAEAHLGCIVDSQDGASELLSERALTRLQDAGSKPVDPESAPGVMAQIDPNMRSAAAADKVEGKTAAELGESSSTSHLQSCVSVGSDSGMRRCLSGRKDGVDAVLTRSVLASRLRAVAGTLRHRVWVVLLQRGKKASTAGRCEGQTQP